MKRFLSIVLALAVAFPILVFPSASPGVAQGDEGYGWTLQNPLPTECGLRGVWGSSASDIFAVGLAGTIVHYNGSSWAPMFRSDGLLQDVWGSAWNDVFVAGSDQWAVIGKVLHYDGSEWTEIYTDSEISLSGIWGSAWNDVWAVGHRSSGGTGAILHYNGSGWTEVPVSADVIHGVWGSAGNDVFAVGDNGTLLHYNGSSWSSMTSPTTTYLYAVWGSAGKDVFAVGYEGVIVHYNGSYWSLLSSGTQKSLEGIWGSSASDVFAVGEDGRIYHYDGADWSLMTSPTSVTLNGVWGSSATDVWAVGDDGVILHYGPLPDSTVDPASVDFGTVTVGSSSSPETVTVSNDGIASLVIGTITMKGANAGQFSKQNDNCSGQTLAPGASATLEVVFTPTSEGAKPAALSIPSNDPDENPFNVPLSGTGTAPPVPNALTLTAEPTNITADGTSTSTLTATVEDQYGSPVPDGTDVVFSTDHGALGSSTVTKQTSGGVATATLTSEPSSETIIATVTAAADGVSDATAVFFIPEGGAEVVESQTETVTDSGTITDTPTGGDVTIDASGDHNVTTAKYADNPGGTPTFQSTDDYYDVHLDDDTGVDGITIEFCPATPDTVIYYWDGADWLDASDQSYAPATGCMVVTINVSTFPSLSDLTGLVFASGVPIPGDADGDGDVDVFDLVKVKRIILGLEPATPGADANQDGEVDVFDLVKIKRIILGLDA